MNKKITLIGVVAIISIILIIFAISSPFIFTQEGSPNFDFTETGQIGDTIGGITAPIIGILGAFLLFLTLLEEYKFNKRHAELSTDEQLKSIFFNLLQSQRDMSSKVTTFVETRNTENTDKVNKVGLVFFRYAIGEYKKRWDIDNNKLPEDQIKAASERFFKKHEYENIDHYFKYIYHILKILKRHENDKIERLGEKAEIYTQFKEYAEFIQAQMFIEELILLFYHSFLFGEYQEIIIHYGIFNNLSESDLVHIKHKTILEKFKNKK
ncbi:MAG: putative phage abortive infection protein [Prevotellaceae bacterium]|jgi:hypothetical protein|nr:putative phage abortive infection protein [Prevotellaceae bacterium]